MGRFSGCSQREKKANKSSRYVSIGHAKKRQKRRKPKNQMLSSELASVSGEGENDGVCEEFQIETRFFSQQVKTNANCFSMCQFELELHIKNYDTRMLDD